MHVYNKMLGAGRFSRLLLAFFSFIMMGGCIPQPGMAPRPEPTTPLAGAVFYRERMALPPDAELYVTLHRKNADGSKLITSFREPTAGKNIPLPFSVNIPTADSSSMTYELDAAILSGNNRLFATARPQLVHPGDGGLMLLLQRVVEVVPELAGVRWKLTELDGKPAEVYDNQPEPHLLFDAGGKGRLAGSDGCNNLLGEYALEGGGIRFSQLGSTMMLCPQGAEQAAAFQRALSEAGGVSRSGDRLELHGNSKTLAVFKATSL